MIRIGKRIIIWGDGEQTEEGYVAEVAENTHVIADSAQSLLSTLIDDGYIENMEDNKEEEK